MTGTIVFAASALAVLLLTEVLRRYAQAAQIMDIPNARSSHVRPVPRGGGLAIVFVVLLGCIVLAALHQVPLRTAAALVGGGSAVGIVGWLDDRRGLSARTRALVHAVAAAWALLCLGGLPVLRLGAAHLALGQLGSVLAFLGIVWLINLYNFMDGIDGIAAGEALSIGVTAAFLTVLAGGAAGPAVLALLLAGSAAGFLVWNWAPARIFMGDAGSGFLGYAFAVMAIASERSGGLPLVVWLVLLAVFLIDATLTLVRRMLAGERWYEAHRSHAYQRLTTGGFRHSSVSGGALLVNVTLAGFVGASLLAAPRLLPWAAAAAFVIVTALYFLVEWFQPMSRPVRRKVRATH